MDSSALYYTLSTIAQTLAGALGVLTAVVVFRLNAVNDAMRSADSILKAYEDRVPVEESLASLRGVRWRQFRRFMERKGIQSFGDREALLKASHAAWRVRRRLWWTLGASGLTIALCFVALPMSASIAGWAFAKPVAGAAVLLGVLCLGFYVWLILALVESGL